MAQDQYATRVLEQLTRSTSSSISPEVEAAFRSDLARAIQVREGTEGITFAPYVNPDLKGEVRSYAPFSGSPSSFAFITRPVDDQGRTTNRFYGVPIVVRDTVSVEQSGILERRIATIRVSKDIDPSTDKLMGLLQEASGSTLERQDQNVSANISYAQLFKAYESEGCSPFEGAVVQRVIAIIPVNPQVYSVEGQGIARLQTFTHQQEMCFGYTIGDVLFRGRPIVEGGNVISGNTIFLPDVNAQGENAFFNIQSLQAGLKSREEGAVGNFVVVALPLVGEEPLQMPSFERGYSNQFDFNPTFSMGGPTRSSFGGFGSIDAAYLSTGKATGTSSKLVNRGFDKTRKISIVDVTLLTLSPEQMSKKSLEAMFS